MSTRKRNVYKGDSSKMPRSQRVDKNLGSRVVSTRYPEDRATLLEVVRVRMGHRTTSETVALACDRLIEDCLGPGALTRREP